MDKRVVLMIRRRSEQAGATFFRHFATLVVPAFIIVALDGASFVSDLFSAAIVVASVFSIRPSLWLGWDDEYLEAFAVPLSMGLVCAMVLVRFAHLFPLAVQAFGLVWALATGFFWFDAGTALRDYGAAFWRALLFVGSNLVVSFVIWAGAFAALWVGAHAGWCARLAVLFFGIPLIIFVLGILWTQDVNRRYGFYYRS